MTSARVPALSRWSWRGTPCAAWSMPWSASPEAVELLHRNRTHIGCYNTHIVQAMAPDGLEQLPIPDCAFIGGSRGNMAEIVCALKRKNPHVRVLITAIALESLHEAIEALERNGLRRGNLLRQCLTGEEGRALSHDDGAKSGVSDRRQSVSARAPRLVIGGTGSGCGKTTITCALLQAFVEQGLDTAAFKCGPDYIDPMFHSRIIGTRSRNLDAFLCGGNKFLPCCSIARGAIFP